MKTLRKSLSVLLVALMLFSCGGLDWAQMSAYAATDNAGEATENASEIIDVSTDDEVSLDTASEEETVVSPDSDVQSVDKKPEPSAPRGATPGGNNITLDLSNGTFSAQYGIFFDSDNVGIYTDENGTKSSYHSISGNHFTLTGTATDKSPITITSGGSTIYIVLDGIDLTYTEKNSVAAWNCGNGRTVNIFVKGTNRIYMKGNRSAINIGGGSTFNFYSYNDDPSDTLEIIYDDDCPGILGSGNVNVYGGTLNVIQDSTVDSLKKSSSASSEAVFYTRERSNSSYSELNKKVTDGSYSPQADSELISMTDTINLSDTFVSSDGPDIDLTETYDYSYAISGNNLNIYNGFVNAPRISVNALTMRGGILAVNNLNLKKASNDTGSNQEPEGGYSTTTKTALVANSITTYAGTLNVTGGQTVAKKTSGGSTTYVQTGGTGIQCSSGFTMNNGNVNVTSRPQAWGISTTGGAFNIKGGVLDVSAMYGGITTNGTFVVENGKVNVISSGAYSVSPKSAFQQVGGILTVNATQGQGIAGSDISISGGTLNVTSKDMAMGSDYATTTISGGNVTLVSSDKMAYYSDFIALTITGGVVKMTGAQGVCAKSGVDFLIIDGGNVQITSTAVDYPIVQGDSTYTYVAPKNENDKVVYPCVMKDCDPSDDGSLDVYGNEDVPLDNNNELYFWIPKPSTTYAEAVRGNDKRLCKTFVSDGKTVNEFGHPTLSIICDLQNESGEIDTFYEKYAVGYYSDASASTSITSVDVPIRTGYTFNGYFTEENGSGTQITDDSGNIIIDNTYFKADTTIYAKWTINQYTLTVNPNGGKWGNETSNSTFTMDYASTKEIADPTRIGYTFNEWTVTGTGATLSGTTFKMGASDATLTAVWTANNYDLTIKPNSGTWNDTTSDTTITMPCDSTREIADPTKAGYTFTGWTLTGSGSSINNKNFKMGYENASLTANWKANEYTLTVKPDGGTWEGLDKDTDITMACDSTREISDPTRTGYTFINWTVAGAGSTLEDSTFTMGYENATLTANWKVNTYKLTVNPDGGLWEGNTQSQSFMLNYSENKTMLDPVKTGYTFDKWILSGEGSKINGTTFTMGHEDATLTASWTANKYTVTFDNNNHGTPSMPNKEVTYDSDYGELATISATGYTFGGWFATSDCTGTAVESTTIVSTASDHTLYAKWTINSFNLNVDPNGGSWENSTQPQSFEMNYAATKTIVNPTRTGYTFVEWTLTGADATLIGTTFTMGTSNATLTAVWTPKTYTVTFDGNGRGTPNPTDKEVTFDSDYGELATISTTGYTFDGWYLNEACTGTAVTPTTKVTTADNHNLYAKWIINKFTLKVDPNSGTWNGTTEVSSFEMNYASTKVIENPTRTGYNFTGWTPTGSGTLIDGVFTMGAGNATLTATWSKNDYTLTVDPNGGTWRGETGTKIFGLDYAETKEIVDPIRAGYTFIDWSLTGTDSTLVGTTFTMGTENATLTANWSANSFKLTVKPNDGLWEGDTTDKDFTLKCDETKEIADPTRTGYTFKEWIVSGTGSTISGTTFKMGSEDATLTANWKINTYTLTVDPNGGLWEGNAQSQVYNIDYMGTKTIVNPTRTGYNFVNWTVSGSDATMSGTTFTMGTENATLTANWTAIEYTVTFNANGHGTPSPAEKTVTYDGVYGELATINATGYTFGGWYLNQDCTGTPVTPTTTVETAENHTLYAKWTAIPYTVTFNANGHGTPSIENITVNYGKAYGELATISATGYAFGGWYLNQDGTGDEIKPDTVVSTVGAHTLYAKWTQINYKLTINPNGGSWNGTTDPSTFNMNYGSVKTIDDPTRTGYKFTGWTLTGTGTIDDDGTFTMGTGEATLTATWSAITYTLTVDPNGGTWENSAAAQEIKLVYGATKEISNPTRAGYTFNGWTISGAGSTLVGSTFTMGPDNATLKANWKAKTYSLTIDPNGGTWEGSNTTETVYVECGSTRTIADPTRTGYKFKEWIVAGEGSTISGSTFTMGSENATITASWTAASYTVIFNSNGHGTPSPESITVRYNSEYGELASIGAVGWTFGGWYLDQDCTGEAITPDTIVKTLGDHTLYAKWTPKSYSLTIDPNGGSWNGSTETQSFNLKYGTMKEITDPTRAGYYFVKWEHTGIGTFTDGVFTMGAGNATLTATWSISAFNLTVDPNGGVWEGKELSQTFTLGYGATKEISNPTRAGYTFKDWTVSGAGSTMSGTTFTMGTDNATLKANWTPNEYNLTIKPNGGTWEGKAEDQIIPLLCGNVKTISHPSMAGYTFVDWTVTGGGSSISGITFTMGYEDATITANWTPASYTINFNANGHGTPSVMSKPVTYGSTYGELAEISAEGFTFGGWYLDQACAGEPVTPDTVVTTIGNHTLYAKWAPGIYKVTYNGADGLYDNRGSYSVSVPYGTVIAVDKNKFVNENYVFAGWNTEKDGSGTAYNPGETFVMKQDVTLYAQWLPEAYRVIYKGNGAKTEDGKDETFIGYAAGDYALIESGDIFIYENYVFMGWSLSPSAPDGKSDYIEGDIYMDGETLTLYAMWKPKDSGSSTSTDTDTNTDTSSDTDTATDTETDDKPLYGDVNCDGKVNMEDVTALQKVIAKLTTHEALGKMSEINSDCKHDGKVNMEDVTQIQKFIAKLVPSLDP